ncbi:hypothetical protein H7271_12220 [Bittarella massiliensis]|nr:hypothetical protein [Bittarella massiliensis (ex Durand et al. 2017)]
MIQNISCRGKFLTLHFESGDRLSLHLRMTGRLLPGHAQGGGAGAGANRPSFDRRVSQIETRQTEESHQRNVSRPDGGGRGRQHPFR